MPGSAWEFASPRRIVFGPGRRREIGELTAEFGRRAFLLHGSRTLARQGRIDEIQSAIEAAGLEVRQLDGVHREPEPDDVDSAVAALRATGLREGDLVVAVGGGAAIDLGKAVAGLATQGEASVVEYLEGVGTGRQIEGPTLPYVAVPTTGGTGSEATKNAVISSYEPAFKKSLRSPALVPDLVVVDPELATSVPADVTTHSGLDAVTQLIESFISCRRRPLPSALAIDGLRRALASDERSPAALLRAVREPNDVDARGAMAHAALLSGMALANSGLGVAHGIAAALGVHARVPHGLACATLLPVALRVNRDAARVELAQLADALQLAPGAEVEERARAFEEHITMLCDELGVPKRLRDLGVTGDQLAAIAQSSLGNSLSGNPRPLAVEDIAAILEDIL